MVKRPVEFNRFEFAVMSGLRAAQLYRGCVPRVPVGTHKATTTAQMEVAEFKVLRGIDTIGSLPFAHATDMLVPMPTADESVTLQP